MTFFIIGYRVYKLNMTIIPMVQTHVHVGLSSHKYVLAIPRASRFTANFIVLIKINWGFFWL